MKQGKEIVEKLSSLSTPQNLTRETLQGKNYEDLSFSELELVKLGKIVEILSHESLADLIQNDFVTLAMIKPRADVNKLGLTDLDASRAIRKEIQEPLKVVFSINIRFSDSGVEEFYKGQKDALQEIPAVLYKDKFRNRWEEFKDSLLSGPTTFLLLFSQEGGALREWRDQIGHWDVVNKRDESTIRGRYAKNLYTSIVHGSDSSERVLEETLFLRDHLQAILKEKDKNKFSVIE